MRAFAPLDLDRAHPGVRLPALEIEPLLPELPDLEPPPAALEHQGKGRVVVDPHAVERVHQEANARGHQFNLLSERALRTDRASMRSL